jgi:hypothetical protein
LVNQRGEVVPADAPRGEVVHWVVVDIPPEVREIPEGASEAVATNEIYGGWDGPCPPWNDERIHRLGFHLFALDIETLGLTGTLTGPEVEAAMVGHVLAEVSLTGLYFISPALDLPPVPERAGF